MKKIFLLFIIPFFAHYSSAQNKAATQKLTDKLLEIKQKHQLIGLSVAVVKNNITVFLASYGLAHEEKKIPLSLDSHFRIASISKSVTATALLTLYEKGRFKLDDDISPVLGFTVRNPKFPAEPITFRHLLTHTSSIVDGAGYDRFLQDSKTENPPLLKEILSPNGKYFTPDIFADYKPSEKFEYCNLTYGIIGTLVEKLSKQRFDKYCKSQIFKPLGLKASFNVEDISLKNLATLYRKDSAGNWKAQVDDFQTEKRKPRKLKNYVIGSNGALFAPQGGLRASPKELAKLMLLHLNKGKVGSKRILKESTVSEMHKIQWEISQNKVKNNDSLMRAWGLGLHIAQGKPRLDQVFPNTQMIGHMGEAYGLVSDWYFDKNTKNGFIFMTNGSAKPFGKGKKSGFYSLEEDVFEAVKTFLDE